MSHNPSISFYRHALRTISRFPIDSLRPKLRYNTRHAIELYRQADPSTADRIRSQALFDFNILSALGTKMPAEDLERMFKGHELKVGQASGRKGTV